ncbi:FAD-dependent oxidoreductase [Asanoa ishikariensis]|uniref:2-polyprenyl-6-methoxyphenol hydroxylase n=1 Tax=Asanoa ishikariensis TaxID=137265 RepID=A0A1H3MXV3_9ACTN|nr:FAD-dependent monooxygenase [Asanoa ishikariensis]GIF68980.1 FAD-dependent oxidoreductase [Asanoa ishikariensis]SDY81416.1 2-polyprenyl-6-methoxyphenol hydroxylase [Asanoa ishikariensis]
MRVLISGAGIAGPALAGCLADAGAETTVVEVAPRLRTSGFAVDFRGPTHLRVLERLGVLDDIKAVQTHGGAMRTVDAAGKTIFELPAEFAGGDVEIRRRDLTAVLHRRSADRTRYVFGDSIVALHDGRAGVEVQFRSGNSGTYDAVVGADGIHSTVRRLAMGPEERFVKHLGYHIAGWDVPNDLGALTVAQQYNVPGRMASVAADDRDPTRAGALVVWASKPLGIGWQDLDAQKRAVHATFDGLGWHVPRLLSGLADAPDLYFDAISRVSVPTLHKGRIALLGDAAWGVTLGGMGVGTGVVGAYVLAGELARAGGDVTAAFAAYEKRMRSYAGRWQKGASPGHFLAPASRTGLWLRNTMFRRAAVRRLLVSSSTALASASDLPDYP